MYVCEGFPDATLVQGLLALLAIFTLIYLQLEHSHTQLGLLSCYSEPEKSSRKLSNPSCFQLPFAIFNKAKTQISKKSAEPHTETERILNGFEVRRRACSILSLWNPREYFASDLHARRRILRHYKSAEIRSSCPYSQLSAIWHF